MSIDTRIREGLSMVEQRLPEVDLTAAYDVITHDRARPVTRPRRVVPRLVAAAAAAALVASGLGAWLHHNNPPIDTRPGRGMNWILFQAPHSLRYGSTDSVATRMVLPPRATSGAWSPDGTQIAYVLSATFIGNQGCGSPASPGPPQNGSTTARTADSRASTGHPTAASSPTRSRGATGVFGLRILNLATGQTQELSTGTRDVSEPRWSPDGTQISLLETRGGAGYLDLLQPVAGSSSLHRILGPMPGMGGNDWSPDGTQLAFTAGSPTLERGTTANLYAVHADGTGVRQITQVASGTRLASVEWETHGTPFLVSAAYAEMLYPYSFLALVSADGHVQPIGGTGVVVGTTPRMRY